MSENSEELAGERIYLGNPVDFVAEELDADNSLGGRYGENLERVSPHPEFVSGEVFIIALVLELDKLLDKLVSAFFHSRSEGDYHITVIYRVA